MVDPDYDSMEDYVDVESVNAYQSLLAEGQSPEEAFRIIKAKSRDNSRTPMQWNDSVNAGFTTGTPCLLYTSSLLAQKYINTFQNS